MATRRNHFLVNRKFQLRFSFYVCSWLFALSLVYPIIIYSLFDFFLRYIASQPGAAEAGALQDLRTSVLGLVILLQLTFLIATFLIGLFLSHKVAGPLHKLGQFFIKAKTGQLGDRLSFRKGDHFPELAEGYNEMVGGIRLLMNQNIEALSTSIARLENAIPHADASQKREIETTLGDLRRVRERLSL